MLSEKKTAQYLNLAKEEARRGLLQGGIPIGSVLVLDDEVIGRGHNQRIQKNSAILHAEMACLEDAGRRTAEEYRRSVLFTTLSPCPMCTGAALLFGIPSIVIGENTTFMGSEELLKSHKVEMIVVDDAECIEMMTKFIKEQPELWNEDIALPAT